MEAGMKFGFEFVDTAPPEMIGMFILLLLASWVLCICLDQLRGGFVSVPASVALTAFWIWLFSNLDQLR